MEIFAILSLILFFSILASFSKPSFEAVKTAKVFIQKRKERKNHVNRNRRFNDM
jgi:hypothetical protein